MAREKNRRKRESRVVDFIIVYVRVKEYGVWNDIKYNWKLKSMEARYDRRIVNGMNSLL